MRTSEEIVLCGYESELGRHELVAVADQRSRTYRVFVRDPNGETRAVRERVPSLRSARQWAIHEAHKQMLRIPSGSVHRGPRCCGLPRVRAGRRLTLR
jgi:hypothetical protein